jgi:DNA-binding MarR family transcriptional regulator
MSNATGNGGERIRLEKLLEADLRNMTAESGSVARLFAANNNLSANDFRALNFVILAEAEGKYLTAGGLRKQMGLSGAAVSYLIERMTEEGYLRRQADPNDRRKTILRYGDPGMKLANTFLRGIDEHSTRALQTVSDEDLEAAHRVFAALAEGMHAFRADQGGADG